MDQRERGRAAWTREASIDGDRVELALTFGLIEEDNSGRPGLKALAISGYTRESDDARIVFSARYQKTERSWGRASVASETLTDFVYADRSLKPLEHEIWNGVTFELRNGYLPFLSTENLAMARREDLPRDWRIVTDALEFLREHIADTLGRIVYLPPLRDAPKRYYASDTEWVRDLMDEPGLFQRQAADKWLSAASLNARVAVDMLNGKEGIAAVYMQEGMGEDAIQVNLRDVGSGVAQVLPIIVASMRAGDDGLVIIEQPELHLHPKAQSELADFFIAMAGPLGKHRFLIETHSESILLRTRLRIAQTTCGQLPAKMRPVRPDELALYFVERPNNASTLQHLSVSPRGRFTQPPEGFALFFSSDMDDLDTLDSLAE